MNTNDSIKMGAGVAAVAGLAYYLLGPAVKKHQKHVKQLIAKAKEANKRIPKSEITALAMDLQKHWEAMRQTMAADAKRTKSVAKKTARATHNSHAS